ncbi:COP23 domain-containing protein [Nostoc sp. UHCC 0302]|uniref:COP23 domain-containing protein n=1 Tax=Nostoc sp. UHCC 0302 TaxID=3134896 RepID=UPI00311CD3EC
MKLKLFGHGLTGIAIASLSALTTIATINQPSYAGRTTFYCEKSKGVPITFASTQDGRKVPMIKWISQDYFSREWTGERRCQEVSRRFQKSYDNGTLKYIRTGTLRGEPVVCAATSQNAPCTDSTLLFTLKRGSNPKETVRRLLNRRGLVAGNIVNENSESTLNIDFDAYLNNATDEINTESN